jgi:hypothetical protein
MVEMPTFQQILEMDDDEEERDFSRSIVYDFFDQAESTFDKMEAALYVNPFHPYVSFLKNSLKSIIPKRGDYVPFAISLHSIVRKTLPLSNHLAKRK